MLRTQVYFDDGDYRKIEQLALDQGVKKAVMVRKVVKAGIKQVQKQPKRKMNAGEVLLEFATKHAVPGPKDLSEKIDEYLYGELSEYATKKRTNRR